MKRYACTDLHGCGWAWNKIKEIINNDDELYCLGDCIDRGSDGIKIMTEIMQRPNTIYIKGNHEDMMYNSIIGPQNYLYSKNNYFYNWTIHNGGKITYDNFISLPPEEQAKILDFIKTMPLTATYINKNNKKIIMSHAGFTPLKGYEPDEEDYLWDRSHFLNDYWYSEYNDTIILHGHSPNEYLLEERGYYVKDRSEDKYNGYELIYCNNHKINIDCGTVFTNKVCLINLDTLEVIHLSKN